MLDAVDPTRKIPCYVGFVRGSPLYDNIPLLCCFHEKPVEKKLQWCMRMHMETQHASNTLQSADALKQGQLLARLVSRQLCQLASVP